MSLGPIKLCKKVQLKINWLQPLFLHLIPYSFKMYNQNTLFRIRLFEVPAISKKDRIPLDLPLCFQSFTINYFELGYFEFPAISNSSLFPYTLNQPCYFKLVKNKSTYISAQLEVYCILFELVLRNYWLNNAWLTCSVPLRNSSCVHCVCALLTRENVHDQQKY